MMPKILVVEDSPEFRKMVSSILSLRFEVESVDSLQTAREKIKQTQYELILLDVMLPDGLGFDLCCEMKIESAENSETPIIFLTGRSSTSDKVYGFSLGAEDYLTKPFEPAELIARVESKIRKSNKNKMNLQSTKNGPFRFEIPSLSLFIEVDGSDKKIDVTPLEFKLLLKLAQNNQRVFSRQQLIDAAWGTNIFVEDRCVDKHISTIRKKIDPFGRVIKTVSGIGYELRF